MTEFDELNAFGDERQENLSNEEKDYYETEEYTEE